MKKAIKKLMTLVLCASMIFGVSSKASALEPRDTAYPASIYGPSYWQNSAYKSAGVMNASTDGNVSNLTKVNLYPRTTDNTDITTRTQMFYVMNIDNYGLRMYVRDQYNPLQGTGFTLNRYTVSPTSNGYRCVLYENLPSEAPYSVIDLRTVASPNKYRIQLVSGSYYLSATSANSSEYLRWTSYQENDKFAWESVVFN